MSRMILAICALTMASGCCNPNLPNRISLVAARFETLGANRCKRECCDCVPHRPWTDDYVDWWDYHITEHTAQKCGFRAFAQYRKQSGCRLSHHFKMGFIAAYEDLALNRRPSPPIVPPPIYWNAYYRSCAGQACVDDWFAGYDAGLSMGQDSSVSRFHEVFLRRGGCNFHGTAGNWEAATPAAYSENQPTPNDTLPQQSLIPTSPMPTTQQTVPLRTLDPYAR